MNKKKNPWKCEKCASTLVDQEWVFLFPMNAPPETLEEVVRSQFIAAQLTAEAEFYWCRGCDKPCKPIRADK